MIGRPSKDWIAIGAGGLLLLATLGEGGGSVVGLAAWHGGLLALLLFAILCRWDRRPAAAPILAWTAFSALVVLGASLASYRYLGWLNLLELACVTTFGVLASGLGDRKIRVVLDLLRLGALIHVANVSVQFAQHLDRPASTFLNANHLGGWLGAVLLLTLAEEPRSPRFAHRAWGIVPSLVCAVGLALSGSRGAWLGLIVGGAWLAYRTVGSLSRSAKRSAAAVGLFVLILGVWSQADRLRHSDPFRYDRVRIWRASVQMLADSPWTGTGPGQFEIAARRYQFPDSNGALRYDRTFGRPHSDLIRAFTEYGVPAGLLALLSVALLVRHVRRRRRVADYGETGYRGVGHGTVAALLAIGVQMGVDHPTNWSALALLGAWLCGRAISIPVRHQEFRAEPSLLLRIGLGLSLVLVFAVGDFAPLRAHRAVPWDAPAGTQAWDTGLRQALELCPVRADLWRLRAENRLSADPDWGPTDYARSRTEIETAIRLSPGDFTHRWALARLESDAAARMFGDSATRTRSRNAFETARALFPTDGRIAIDAGRAALRQGDRVFARRQAEEALVLEPNAVPAMLLLADALVGDRPTVLEAKRARDWIQRAKAVSDRFSSSAAAGTYAREMLTFEPTYAASILDRAGDLP